VGVEHIVTGTTNDALSGVRPPSSTPTEGEGASSTPIVGTVFDDDGNLMPGAVDHSASFEVQQQELQRKLQEQGFDLSDAAVVAWEYFELPIAMRDQALSVKQAREDGELATAEMEGYVPGSQADETVLLAGPSGAGTSRLRWLLDGMERVQTQYDADRHLVYLRVQVEKWQAREDQAIANGDMALAQTLRQEREMIQGTVATLEIRRENLDYRSRARDFVTQNFPQASYAGFSQAEIREGMERWLRQETPQTDRDKAIRDLLVRTTVATNNGLYINIVSSGDPSMFLTEGPSGTAALAASGIAAVRGSRAAVTSPSGSVSQQQNLQLRHPSTLIGNSDGGPGVWDWCPIRKKGVEYQEQVTGVPREIEYKVNDVWFDGYDASRNTLIDAKDWGGYVLPDKPFWQESVGPEAERQLRAVASLGRQVGIEWQVSTQEAADAIRRYLSGRNLTGINVVVVPKTGG
jgi:energy-coupling factor transporter ATP-binding protein EcfA2